MSRVMPRIFGKEKWILPRAKSPPRGLYLFCINPTAFLANIKKKICLKNDIRGHNLVQYISPSKHLPGFFVNYRIGRLRE